MNDKPSIIKNATVAQGVKSTSIINVNGAKMLVERWKEIIQ